MKVLQSRPLARSLVLACNIEHGLAGSLWVSVFELCLLPGGRLHPPLPIDGKVPYWQSNTDCLSRAE